jgi:hypothetical protein
MVVIVRSCRRAEQHEKKTKNKKEKKTTTTTTKTKQTQSALHYVQATLTVTCHPHR